MGTPIQKLEYYVIAHDVLVLLYKKVLIGYVLSSHNFDPAAVGKNSVICSEISLVPLTLNNDQPEFPKARHARLFSRQTFECTQ